MAEYSGPLDHTSVLDLLLSHACPVDDRKTGVSTFRIDLHCKVVEVDARLVSTVETIKWEIVAVRDADDTRSRPCRPASVPARLALSEVDGY
jgi:hypothetical protein